MSIPYNDSVRVRSDDRFRPKSVVAGDQRQAHENKRYASNGMGTNVYQGGAWYAPNDTRGHVNPDRGAGSQQLHTVDSGMEQQRGYGMGVSSDQCQRGLGENPRGHGERHGGGKSDGWGYDGSGHNVDCSNQHVAPWVRHQMDVNSMASSIPTAMPVQNPLPSVHQTTYREQGGHQPPAHSNYFQPMQQGAFDPTATVHHFGDGTTPLDQAYSMVPVYPPVLAAPNKMPSTAVPLNVQSPMLSPLSPSGAGCMPENTKTPTNTRRKISKISNKPLPSGRTSEAEQGAEQDQMQHKPHGPTPSAPPTLSTYPATQAPPSPNQAPLDQNQNSMIEAQEEQQRLQQQQMRHMQQQMQQQMHMHQQQQMQQQMHVQQHMQKQMQQQMQQHQLLDPNTSSAQLPGAKVRKRLTNKPLGHPSQSEEVPVTDSTPRASRSDPPQTAGANTGSSWPQSSRTHTNDRDRGYQEGQTYQLSGAWQPPASPTMISSMVPPPMYQHEFAATTERTLASASISVLDFLAFRECSLDVPEELCSLNAVVVADRQPSDASRSSSWLPAKHVRMSAKDMWKHGKAMKMPDPVPVPMVLHKSTNAYRASMGSMNKSDPDEELKRNVKSILNKMCPEKFEVLAEKLALLKIQNATQLATIIDYVFTKAVTEHAYCEMYSDLCMALRPRYPSFPALEPGEPDHTFTRVLLNRCQEEFDNLPTTFDGDFENGNSSLPSDPSEREHLIKKNRDKVLGNMKFIGQLFLRRLLSYKVVREVVIQLIFREEKPVDHYIECLCILLRNIGASLESTAMGTEYSAQFIARLKQLLKLDYSKRIKFTMQGIIELQENRWQDRVLHEKAKTKDEIRLSQFHEDRRRSSGLQNPFAVMEIAGQRPSYIRDTHN